MRSVAFPLFVSCAILCLALTGCGQARTEVSGEVTYNGKPIESTEGTISFFGSDGIPVAAKIDSSGKYRATGVCVGDNRVAVSYQRPVPKVPNKRVPKTGEPPVVADQGSSPFLIPDTYLKPDTSGLTVAVERNTVYSPKLTGPELK
jgi:hypothetical protein